MTLTEVKKFSLDSGLWKEKDSMVNLNIQITETLANEIKSLIKKGIFKDQTEAINSAIKLMVKRYKVQTIGERILKTRERLGDKKINLTEEIIHSHEEDLI